MTARPSFQRLYRVLSRDQTFVPACTNLGITEGLCSHSAAAPNADVTRVNQRFFSSNVDLIKELRFRTGAPMKDVKAALELTNWNIDEAMTELRKKGMTSASKKKSRLASEGLLGLALSEEGGLATVVEVNSETDFVARNDLFRSLVSHVARAALEMTSAREHPGGTVQEVPLSDMEGMTVDLQHEKLQGKRTLAEAVAEVSALTGEHVALRRAFACSTPSDGGFVATYLHSSPARGLGRIAGLVSLQHNPGSEEKERLRELGQTLAMHAVALKPVALRREDVPKGLVDKERDVLKAQALASGKPAGVVEKMVEGRLRKFFAENVFLEQPLVTDESISVQKYIQSAAKDVGPISLCSFLRLEVGEGMSGSKDE